MSSAQIRNDEMVNLLSADFQRRWEASFAWRTACAAYQLLPGLRGLWPMSSFGATGQAFDLSGQGRTLTLNGNATYNYVGLIPLVGLDGTDDYLSRADEAGLDITGIEGYIVGAVRGLTLYTWCYPRETGTDEVIIGKWTGGVGNRSYIITLGIGDRFNGRISDDGTNSDSAQSAVVTMNNWYHLALRFIPSTSVDLFVNGVEYNQATARVSIFNGNANFCVGAYSGGANEFNGRESLVGLYAMAHSNAQILSAFHQTKAMFGVS